MQTLDMTFFEEFKRLESICNDMFSCKSGVTEYITQMEQAADKGRLCVSGWDADYKTLKHLRWVRNQIAHSEDTGLVATQEDLTQLRRFHKRVLSQEDPLCMLTKAVKARAAAAKTKARPKPDKGTSAVQERTKAPAADKTENSRRKPEKGSRAGAVILLVIVILLVLAGISLLYLDISGRTTASAQLKRAAEWLRSLAQASRMRIVK